LFGLLEILIIAVVVILLFGYNRIPMLGKSLGTGISEFRRSFKRAAGLEGSTGEAIKKKEADGRRKER
jgi:TatA/E family protein of Tat protein translocase